MRSGGTLGAGRVASDPPAGRSPLRARARDAVRLWQLSLQQVAGRRWWLSPLIVLTWPALQLTFLALGWRQEPFTAVHAQTALAGLPLTLLGLGLGVRIIAGEIDRRTLEIAYTVPGGAQRVWLAKLIASIFLLIPSLLVLALVTVVFITDFPLDALYGAFQGAVVYMVLGMALAALFKSEATGALVTGLLLVFNGLLTGFGGNQIRISPFWNPLVLEQRDVDPAELLAWTIQNRIGMVLLVVAVLWLAIGRAERRETLLG